MRENEQLMTKMRLRRLLEEILDGDLVQVDIEEGEELATLGGRPEIVKRLSVVARYIPA